MLIDWFTVVSQAINFLLLVWLMKRFLYKPILNAIDAREKLIAFQVKTAQENNSKAKEENEIFKKKNQDFDERRSVLMGEVVEAAELERKGLLEGARKEADDLKTENTKSFGDYRKALIEDLNRRARNEVFAIARKILGDLAESSLEGEITETFIRKMNELSSEERKVLTESFKQSFEVILIKTTFELSSTSKKSLSGSIKSAFNVTNSVEFQTSPELISGIELTCGGQRVSWSISGYLSSLERSVAEAFPA